MNKKTLRILGTLFLLFFVAGITVVSAQSRSELNEAYEAGYSKGYRDCRSRDARMNSRNVITYSLREYPIRVPDTEQGRLRSKYVEGYGDGWEAKLATFE